MTIHVEKFEAWLFSQPIDRAFNFMDNCGCALASFFHETTSLQVGVADKYFRILNSPDWNKEHPMPDWTFEVLRVFKVTYGEGLKIGATISVRDMQKRFRELFPEQPIEEALTNQAEQILKNV